MDQNRNENNSETVVFEPLKKPVNIDVPKEDVPYEEYYEEQTFEEDEYDKEDEYEEDEEESDDEKSGNGILIGVVIVLLVLFIAAVIWFATVFNKMMNEDNAKKANNKNTSVVQQEQTQEEEEEEVEGEASVCRFKFFTDDITRESDGSYTVRAIIYITGGTTLTDNVIIDSETDIREDGVKFSTGTFISVLKGLNEIELEDGVDVLFSGTYDIVTMHVESISYEKEMLEALVPEEPEEPVEGTEIE